MTSSFIGGATNVEPKLLNKTNPTAPPPPDDTKAGKGSFPGLRKAKHHLVEKRTQLFGVDLLFSPRLLLSLSS